MNAMHESTSRGHISMQPLEVTHDLTKIVLRSNSGFYQTNLG